MTRIRLVQMCSLGALSLQLGASVAVAQPAPPPPGAPPAAPPAADMPPPPPPMYPVAAAITAPKSPDDMTGSIGFGAGLVGSGNIIGTVNADPMPGAVPPPTKFVAIRYWSSDMLVLQPSLFFAFSKTSMVDASWTLDPELVALFVPVKGTSTRLLVGGGLGINIQKAPPNDVTFAFYLPIQAGVEHFFTRWFAMGIAARTNFFQMQTGDPWNITMAINSTSLLGNVFFYTD